MRNTNFLRYSAWRFILEHRITSLPISTARLAKKLSYHLETYEEYSKVTGISEKEMRKQFSKFGFSFWSEGRGQFVICYNQRLQHSTTRWTVMHEIGHIQLGHIKKDGVILRCDSRSWQETEANGFTRRVLCPSIVLHELGAIEVNDIMDLCGISRTSAKIVSDYMKELEARGKFETAEQETQVKLRFMPFIKSKKDDLEISEEFCA